MNDYMVNREYVRSEMEYRLDRVRDDIVGRRRRRSLRQRRNGSYATVR